MSPGPRLAGGRPGIAVKPTGAGPRPLAGRQRTHLTAPIRAGAIPISAKPVERPGRGHPASSRPQDLDPQILTIAPARRPRS
jgi:hypothetical protein